jgi:hypothetical protein
MKYYILLLIFIALGLAVYSNIINSFFASDDFGIIELVSKGGPFALFSFPPTNFFRPLISLSLFLDYKLWGLNPSGYHLTSILIHAFNAFFVFLISSLLVNEIPAFKKNFTLPIFSGLLFLILHSHAEAVSWICCRCDVFATFFCLASFYTYLLYKKDAKLLHHLTTSLFLFACALLSKESAASYPFIILSYEFYSYIIEKNKRKKFSQVFYLPAIYFIIFIVYLFFRYKTLGTIVGGYGNAVHLNFGIKNLLQCIISNCARTFLPPLPGNIIPACYLWAFIIFIAFFIKAIRRKTASKLLYFLIVSFIISLLPVINMLISVTSIMGERFIYLPSAFASILFVLLLSLAISNKKALALLLTFILLSSAFLLYRSNENCRAGGEVSRNVVDYISRLKKVDRLFIINLPATINGARIFFGLDDFNYLIRLINPRQINKGIPICLHNISGKDDAIKITKRSGIISIRSLSPIAVFNLYDPNSGFDTEYYEILNFTGTSFDLKFKDFDKDKDKIIYYSRGRMEAFEF